MSREPATEFKARIETALEGGYEWSIETVNGSWPYWLTRSQNPLLRTKGRTATRRGARKEARRTLQKIRRYVASQEADPEIIHE